MLPNARFVDAYDAQPRPRNKAVAMKAETTRRPCLPACANTLRMK
jgi:hypothetical protein